MVHWNVPRARFLAMFVTAVAIAFAPAACSDATGPDDRLAAARRQWSSAGPAAYSVTLGRGCFCAQEVPSPVVITVRNGVIESRHYKTTGAPVSPAYADAFPDVEGLFDVIEDALENADRVDVKYHSTLGYPLEIFIDYIRNAIDDELAYMVTDLTVR